MSLLLSIVAVDFCGILGIVLQYVAVRSWEYCFTKRKGFEWLCFVFTLAVLI